MLRINKFKRIFAVITCVMLMITMMLPLFSGVLAASDSDVIMVVDDTRSMQQTDPDKLTACAIRQFVDKFPADTESKFGIATYAIDVLPVSLEIGQDASSINDFANNCITQDGKGTDAAVGLDWAINQLETNSNSNNKAIILVGDGENSFIVANQAVRTAEDSNAMLDAAIQKAKDNGIKIYTVAINPIADNFRQYFSNIASDTEGASYEPKTADEVDACMDKIYASITGEKLENEEEKHIVPDKPYEKKFEVPEDVFEMNFQCDQEHPIDIKFIDPDGDEYNKNSKSNVAYSEEETYTNFKIFEPMSGSWKMEITSDVEQDIKPQFIYHKDLSITVAKNQKDITQMDTVQFSATVDANGETVNDGSSLSGLSVKLVVTTFDKNGNPKKTSSEDMQLDNGKFVADYKFNSYGQHEAYVEVVGGKNTLESNKLTFDVARNPLVMTIILVVAGVLLLLIIIIVLSILLTNMRGTGMVTGHVSIKITGKNDDDIRIFDQEKFDCSQVFRDKKNILSQLIDAYIRRYRINNDSEMAETDLMDYISTSKLKDVTEKVIISANKRHQTFLDIPALFEMKVDGFDIKKTTTKKAKDFDVTLDFKNQGIAYTIYLAFTGE